MKTLFFVFIVLTLVSIGQVMSQVVDLNNRVVAGALWSK